VVPIEIELPEDPGRVDNQFIQESWRRQIRKVYPNGFSYPISLEGKKGHFHFLSEEQIQKKPKPKTAKVPLDPVPKKRPVKKKTK